jgi:hypothetical protein
MPSWKPEVTADNVNWDCNTMRFATRDEAYQCVAARWDAVRNYHTTQCDDPVTYVFRDGRAIPLEEVPPNLIGGLSK